MYVIEGATLGGQVIVRRVNKLMRLPGPHGAGFYAGYGLHNGRMWLSFKAAAEPSHRPLDSRREAQRT
jgi:heme oxygenase